MADPTAWQLVADEVIAVMLASQQGFEAVRYEHSALIDHFPPGPYRDTVRALDTARMADKPVHITTLHVDAGVPLDWLSDRFVLARAEKKLDGPVLAENVRRLKEYGAAWAQQNVMQWGAGALSKATDADQRAQVISEVVTRLGQDMSEDVRDASAAAAAARFEELLAAEPTPTMTTGIPWFDIVTNGGLSRGNIWWIAAAYKRRKSTLLRIMALALAEAGISVTICALEGTQQEWVADFIAMLSVRWLFENDHWEKKANSVPLHTISSSLLLKWGNSYKTRHPLQVAAINAGIQAYKALRDRLRIYDRQPENGGLGTLGSIETIINRDIARYGMAVCFVDHLQLVDAGLSTEFENVTKSSRTFQALAAGKNIAMVVLAQLNEEAVKYAGSKSHSPGIKGGGAPAATADFIIQTGYPHNDVTDEEDKTRLQIRVGWARRGSEGGVNDFAMHPPTGWLIPTRTIDASAAAGDAAGGYGGVKREAAG